MLVYYSLQKISTTYIVKRMHFILILPSGGSRGVGPLFGPEKKSANNTLECTSEDLYFYKCSGGEPAKPSALHICLYPCLSVILDLPLYCAMVSTKEVV